MRVSYDRLWKLMKNNKMTKRDLAQAAGFSQYMMGQFTKAEYVSLKEIATLCGIFHCKHRLTRAHREKQLKMSCQALHNAPPNRT